MSELGILPQPEPFGKYYLLERVNIGGMAEIYKAKAFGVEGFERLLAVKKILASIAEDESFINMFIDEAKITGQLHHPNIAQIFDLGKVNESYFIALEYISGKDLKTIFERSRRLGEKVSIPRVCHLIMKACEGLGYAHDKKDAHGQPLHIVHRDISPQNILMSYEGEVKLIDFGIAKAQGKTSQTQVGILKGKFSYMSPEQVRGLHIDHRSDIFSLGIVLYEMLTLERLFLGESDFDTLERIRKVEMSPPSLYNTNIPNELEEIVLKALAKSPEDRYQSAYELAEALEQFMRHQGYYYTNKDLSAYMKETFSADIEFENKKVEYYRSLDLKPPVPEAASPRPPKPPSKGGGLSWDDDELATNIYDRAEESIEIDMSSLGADIVYSSGGVAPVSGSTTGPQRAVQADEHEDRPTVEYDRANIRDAFASMSFDDEPPRATPGERAYKPTMQVSAVEPRRDLHHTSPGMRVPPAAPPQGGVPVALKVAGAVVLIGAPMVFLAFTLLSKKTSTIDVQVQAPKIKLLVDGQTAYEGPSPHKHDLEAGQHKVEVLVEGFEPYVLTRQFEKGQPYELSQKHLTPVEDKQGLVTVKLEPSDATLEIDGKSATSGEQKLAEGTHIAKLTKTGYEPLSREIKVKAGDKQEVPLTLKPLKIALKIDSAPARSKYEVFEKDTNKKVAEGQTPDLVDELFGNKTYRVVVSQRTYEDWESELKPGNVLKPELKARLERAKSAAVSTSRSASPPERPTPRPTPPKPTPPKPTPPKPKPTPPKPKPKPTPPKPKPAGMATLTIASKPAARIWIDGKDSGKYTPQINLKVPAKSFKLELINKEFNLHKTYYLTLKPGESRRIINR